MAGIPYHTGDSGLWTSHRFGEFHGRIETLSGPGVAELVPPAGALTTTKESPDG